MTSEPHQGTARCRVLLTRGALIAACGIAAAACGSAAAPSSAAHGGGTSGAATTSAAKVSLDVLLTGGADATAKHWTLRCEPAGGNFPDAASACVKLLKFRTIFNPWPTHIMCPMIMADARTYIVSGTFLGKKVHVSIIDGGCDIGRWGQLNQVFN